MLPYWINFHEENRTFTMYPPDTSNKITVEVKCCNSIEQCTVSQFEVLPKDTAPISLLTSLATTFVLQYDPDPNLGAVGQGFMWDMQHVFVYDPDVCNNPADTYFLTNQIVNMQFTSYGIGTGDYFQIRAQGIVFGQAFLNNVG